MKKLKIIIVIILAICLVACGGGVSAKWQEQYDLGMKYLLDAEYEEAVLAFTTAIEIEPKLAEAYIGRGDAYVQWGEAESDTAAEKNGLALADYLQAIDLDEKNVDAYGKAAEVYILLDDIDAAVEIMEKGYEITKDERLNERKEELGLTEVVWTDPVFEGLIRGKLGLGNGTIYAAQLDSVESLIILGNTHVFINDEIDPMDWAYRFTSGEGTGLEAFYGIGLNDEEFEKYTQKGSITNVETLKYFKNLEDVFIIANHITDISILREMENLKYADFWANDISDLSPCYEMEGDHTLNEEQFVEIGDIMREY